MSILHGSQLKIQLIMNYLILTSQLLLLLFLTDAFAYIDGKDLLYAKSKQQLNSTSSTNTYAEAYNYGQTHPTRDGESWFNLF